MNININAFKNKNLRFIVDTAIGLTAKGLECNCKLYSFMSVDCRLKQENVDRVTIVAVVTMPIVNNICFDIQEKYFLHIKVLSLYEKIIFL